ncbi:hypothetical protein [Chitinimonas koreensis]|uniref:hypothetical protein n=1 Tax=Chitinimonas koreensis TaxID=356302 RepID=UPI000405C7AC|nr:hypothetical protein [Chitinimonas koreensis]QNM97626.1 hypothetical protein H9L41_04820 [Chitinimonas koreensis]
MQSTIAAIPPNAAAAALNAALAPDRAAASRENGPRPLDANTGMDPLGAGAEESSRALEETAGRHKVHLERRRFGNRRDAEPVKRIEELREIQAMAETEEVQMRLADLARQARDRAGQGDLGADWLRQAEPDPVARAAVLEIAQAGAEAAGEGEAAARLEQLTAELWQGEGDAIQAGLLKASSAQHSANQRLYYDDVLGNTRQPEELFDKLRGHFGDGGFRRGLASLRRTMAGELAGTNPAVSGERQGQLMIDLQQIATIRSLVAQADDLRGQLRERGIETGPDALKVAESVFGLTSGPLFAKTLFKTVDGLPRDGAKQPIPLYAAFRRFLSQTPLAIWAQGGDAKQKALEHLDMRLAALARAEAAQLAQAAQLARAGQPA